MKDVGFPSLESHAASWSALEQHAGIVSGYVTGVKPRPMVIGQAGHPRAALESVVREQMAIGQTFVLFSGGRDSSLVLAIAALVARREGVDPPVALSTRYRDVEATHESEWQDLVVGHLGVPHEVIEVPQSADELAAPLAFSRIVRDGPTYPPTCGINFARISDIVGGGVVLTGEGGDEVLGGSRITSFTGHFKRRRRPDRLQAAQMSRELCPRPLRRRLVRKQLDDLGGVSWLQPDVHATVRERLVSDHLDQPWDWREARWNFLRARRCILGFNAMRTAARREKFDVVHPLIHEDFVAALCSSVDRWGLMGRGEAMQRLAADLLPSEVLRRQSKASFNGVFAGERVRAFARQWDGSGVDADLVDVEKLRRAWLSNEIPGPALSPLQLALAAAAARGWAPSADLGVDS